MRTALILLTLLARTWALAGTFTIHVQAPHVAGEVVTLLRYDDLLTLRTVLLTRALLDSTGKATLSGEVDPGLTHRVQLRIGDITSDLYLRSEHVLNIRVLPTRAARSLSGTTRADLEFTDLSPLDVNALTADLNERVDDFIAEDLATDRAAGMQALEVTRQQGDQQRDSTERPPTLFVMPTWSEIRVDTFEQKLERFYRGVDDAWFTHYRHFSMAGLRHGPRANDKTLYERYLADGAVHYDDPEYMRFLRSFFADLLPSQVLRDTGDSLQQRLRAGDLEGAKACFKRNDFLRPHDRLAELVLLDQLYLQHPGKLLDRAGVERTLMSAKDGSAYPEHRRIAGNMLWDLTTMRQGTALPALRVVDERDRPLDLDSLFNGPVCLAVTASWCTYCAVEMVGLEQLHQEYKGVIRIIGISLDSSAAELRSYRKAHTGQDFTWVRAMADQELREQLRLRSLPAFFLLNDGILARSPAPLPSNGLGGLFHQAKVATEQDQRIKVWEEPEGIRDERATPPTPR